MNHFTLKILFLGFIIMYPGMDCFELILFGIHGTSWVVIFMPFIIFGKISPFISSNIVCTPLPFPSLSGDPTTYIDLLDGLPLILLALFTSAILFCLSVPQIQSFLLLYLHLHWVFFLPTQMFSNPSSEFSILVLVLFSFRKSFWFLFRFSVCSVLFSICSYIVSLLSPWLPLVN